MLHTHSVPYPPRLDLFSHLMNRAAEMADSPSFFQRNIASRAAMGLGGTTLEAWETVRHAIRLPLQSASLAVKIPAIVINTFVDSESLEDFARTLTGPLQLLETAWKVIAYAIGTLFTAALGVISPKENFHLHFTLGLVRDEKAELAAHQAEQEKIRQREAHERAIQTHIKHLIEAIRLKNVEKEKAESADLEAEEEPQIEKPIEEEKPEELLPSSVEALELAEEEVRVKNARK